MKHRASLIAVGLAALTLTVGAQERDRAKVANQYTWNLADLYSSDAAWRADKEAAQAAAVKRVEEEKGSGWTKIVDSLEAEEEPDGIKKKTE